MNVDAATANGERRNISVVMTADWCLRTSDVDLPLQAVLPSISLGLVYLFAPSKQLEGDVQPLPAAAAELLLYAPLVALVKCPQGFQSLSWSAWRDLTSSACLQDFGMPSSMATSLNAGVEEDLETQSLASISDMDFQEEAESEDLGEQDVLSDASEASDVSE